MLNHVVILPASVQFPENVSFNPVLRLEESSVRGCMSYFKAERCNRLECFGSAE